MSSYAVVVCGRCGGYLLAKTDQKTKTCPYCGSKIFVEKAKKAAVARNAYEASALLRKLKEEKAAKRTKLGFKGYFEESHQSNSEKDC
jgi:DNA-directed RNA polymerase subunit RPC12/RpoP